MSASSAKAWKEAHRQEWREYRRAWRKLHPESSRESRRLAQRRRRGSTRVMDRFDLDRLLPDALELLPNHERMLMQSHRWCQQNFGPSPLLSSHFGVIVGKLVREWNEQQVLAALNYTPVCYRGW